MRLFRDLRSHSVFPQYLKVVWMGLVGMFVVVFNTNRTKVWRLENLDTERRYKYIVLNIMNFFTRNIIVLGRVTALLFLVASSGFTTILHICTMDVSECCDPSGASDHDACPNNPSLPATGASIQDIDECHINAVAGGLSAIQALLEKDIKAQNVNTLTVLISTFVSLAPSTNTSSFTYSYAESVSPPSVEKYVLNETFLI